jgi:hypothetical protein
MTVSLAPTYPLKLKRSLLPPAWPLYALMFGLPLWWILGLGSLIWPVFALPMALWLWAQPKVYAPQGFGVWVLFIAWVVASATQLDTPDRLVSFGYRLALYISAGVLMLYVYNLPEQVLPRRRVIQMCAAVWVVTVAGGFAALAWPTMSMASLVERFLPAGLASHPFIYDLVHLRFSQYSIILEYPVPRPTAPFAYTNDWGSNLAILTPIYVLWLIRSPRGMLRLAGLGVLLASVVPMVGSLNRGLWLSLGVGAIYATLRLAVRGRGRPLLIGAAVLAVAAAGFALSPLPQIAADRLATPHSDEGRRSIYEGAAEGALQSPILGYGTTRPQDSEADTGGRQVGTHGQLWMVLFSHGFPGLALFLAWLLLLYWRTRPADMSDRFFVHVALFIALVQMPFYGLVPAQIQILMMLSAVVLRPSPVAAAAPAPLPVAVA